MPTEQIARRADAERNRVALVQAARAVFSERGLDAPLDVIARRAGVGNATLYRHFPSRRELLVAVFSEQMADYADAARRALEDVDPWEGFAAYVRHVCAVQAADRALADLVTTSGPGEDDELDALRARSYRDLRRLIRRARDHGALRADFTAEDVVLLLIANAGIVARAGELAPQASERLATLVLDGLRAEAATTPAAPAIRPGAMLDVMRGHARHE